MCLWLLLPSTATQVDEVGDGECYCTSSSMMAPQCNKFGSQLSLKVDCDSELDLQAWSSIWSSIHSLICHCILHKLQLFESINSNLVVFQSFPCSTENVGIAKHINTVWLRLTGLASPSTPSSHRSSSWSAWRTRTATRTPTTGCSSLRHGKNGTPLQCHYVRQVSLLSWWKRMGQITNQRPFRPC